jgi:hypothetical protein
LLFLRSFLYSSFLVFILSISLFLNSSFSFYILSIFLHLYSFYFPLSLSSLFLSLTFSFYSILYITFLITLASDFLFYGKLNFGCCTLAFFPPCFYHLKKHLKTS